MDGAFAQRLVERGGDRDARDRLRRYHPGRLMVVPAALDLYPPGVRLIGGRRRAPIRRVLHAAAGFSGIPERGPVASAVRGESAQALERGFGGSLPEGFRAPSSNLFLDNRDIGKASGRGRGCQWGLLSVGDGY